MINNLLEDNFFLKLKFNKKWLELEVVDSDNFIKLKERYLTKKNDNNEHYRWEAFVRFIKKTITFRQNYCVKYIT